MSVSTGRLDRGEDKRAEILDAAAQCFMLRGYYATSIDQIADFYGSTKGLIYYHFRSKTELFFEVYRRTIVRTIERVRPIASTNESASVRLRNMCRAHVHGIIDNLANHHVSKQGVESHITSALTPDQNKDLRSLIALRDDYEAFFHDVIADGMKEGVMRSGDPSLAARTILGGLNGFSVWYRPRPKQSRAQQDHLVEQVVDVILNGLVIDGA
ncbi:TetR/AcrR family transcriptional regulator [Caballeronia sp. SEWSISQ10-4 2]|jgi:AcrR family transcriptional regulator|uniref:TetR/AcrR family transcriptional regulator n=1 Tax=Caballeronia sp. SEWSISQ10-4 2 TaxID=2937438 RepID=UPI0026508661|nr:TetR/AcrR family transcriptional regulator [Caballeronia sp. SEWSISQ10-4 2]MDN7177102.1 TetR/AcrR family transcriptional regulator [Caballeronia sp. SEWSISQ10-4 2]